ncbi:restriction endonuclease subunit S [Prevotella sp.]|uniref:restriction endonuclease subunit S n=1 Tax=Prevotella sp. TaxID=59823 RepID=UPI003AF1BFF8
MTTTINNEHKKLNVPNLRFKEFEGEWEESTIGEMFDLYSGNTPSRLNKEHFKGTVNWISSGELKEHYLSSSKEQISEEAAKNLKLLPVGTFVIAIYGLEAEGVRGTGSITQEPSTISQACMSFIPKGVIENEFLYSWYKKHGNVIGIRYAQGTKQQNLSYDILEKFRIAYPNTKEQEKLNKFISLLDKRIATQNKIIEDLKKLKSAISHILFSSKCAIRLSDIANVIMGQSPSSNAYNDQGIGMPLVQGNLDISNGNTTPRLYTAEFNQTAEEGNIILTVRAPVGEVAKATKKVCLGRGVCAIIPHEENMSDFIYQYLTFYKFMWRKYEQGSTFTSINGSDVRNIPCPKVRNVSILTLLDRKINIEERVIKLYKSQKQYMLCQMFI